MWSRRNPPGYVYFTIFSSSEQFGNLTKDYKNNYAVCLKRLGIAVFGAGQRKIPTKKRAPEDTPKRGFFQDMLMGFPQQCDKLVFSGFAFRFPVIANQSADWCGNPPVERNQVTITTKNHSSFLPSRYLSVHFPSNRGIATTSVRTGLAMTASIRQTPICQSIPAGDTITVNCPLSTVNRIRGAYYGRQQT